MLNYLRRRAANILAAAETVTLSTSGPAGLQARSFPCQAHGILLYLLLPGTSDHLLNLEQNENVVVSTSGWQLRGWGRVLPLAAGPADLMLSRDSAAIGCVILEIHPSRLQIHRLKGWGFSETLDIEDSDSDLT